MQRAGSRPGRQRFRAGGGTGFSSTDATTASSGSGEGDSGVVNVGTQEGESAGDDDETWTGYVEQYSFPSGSDDLVLTFTRNADGGVTGHAVFGSLPFYPPPTDPSVGYPIASLDGGNQEPNGSSGAFEGFRYTLVNGSIDGTRLRATVDSNELYARWCPLEPSFPDDLVPGTYLCAPADYQTNLPASPSLPLNCSYETELGAEIPIDCARAYLCKSGVCTCTSSACSYTPGNGPQPSFDFQIEGSQASGSVILQTFDVPHDIHLARQ